MRIKGILLLILMHCMFFLHAQDYAFTMNNKLGKGVSIGDAFELNNLSAWDVKRTPYLIKEIKEKGFSHVRIPVRWSEYIVSNSPVTLQAAFFDTIQWAVDLALQEDLIVVLNIQNFESLYTEPNANKAKFLGIWTQLSKRFEGYSNNLFFELLDAPQLALTSETWNEYLNECISIIREKHPTRILIVGASNKADPYALQDLLLPLQDTAIIASIQYFSPTDFTRQQIPLANTELVYWDSTLLQTSTIKTDIDIALAYSNTRNIPIYVSAFGVTQIADSSSRKRWVGYVSSLFESYGFSSSYWEFASNFGIYNFNLDCYNTSILHALVGANDECDCAKFDTINIKNSSFVRLIEPWTFTSNVEIGAIANIDIVNGEAKVTIQQTGGQDWHIQFKLDPLEIQYGSTYTFQFDGYASEITDVLAQITYGLGQPDKEFLDVHALPVTFTTKKKTFSTTFVMTEPTSKNMRIVFELGIVRAQELFFDNIHLYEVEEAVAAKTVAIYLDQQDANYIIDQLQGSLNLKASVMPVNAASTKVVWSVIEGADIASVDQTGKLTAKGTVNGFVTVQAKAFDGNGAKAIQEIEIKNQETVINNTTNRITFFYNEKQFFCQGTHIISARIIDVNGKSKKLSIKSISQAYLLDSAQLSESLKVIAVTTDAGTFTFKIIP